MLSRSFRDWFRNKKKEPIRLQRLPLKRVQLLVETLEDRLVPTSPTTTALGSSGAAIVGNLVTFTATVTSTVDVPAGTVAFFDGTTSLGSSTLASGTVTDTGVATLTSTLTYVGTHNITAVYTPTGTSLPNDAASSGTYLQPIDYTPGDLVVSQVGFSTPIANVAVNGTTVTVTTANSLPYAVSATAVNLWLVGNSGTNINGSAAATITGVNTFTYTSASAVAGTGGTVSPASSFTISTVSVSGLTVSVTTTAATGFLAGQQVKIAGNSGTNINGIFTVASVSSTTLKYISAGAVAGTGGTAAGATPLTSSAAATYLDDFTVTSGSATQNAGSTVNLPTAIAAATITTASWASATSRTTYTTSAANNFQAGQLVTVSGVTPSTFNGTFYIISVATTTPFSFTVGVPSTPGTYVSGGSALVAQGALTEGGTSTTQGYLTNSLDGHTLTIGGYDQTVAGSTTATAAVGLVGASGNVNDSTLLPSSVTGVKATISADGGGMWVATGTGIRYVSFANSTSAITAASWSSGIATITAANMYVAGETVVVAGIAVATGYNGTVYVLSASATQFTYALTTQPTGTPTFAAATSVLQPTLVTTQANNPNSSTQVPSTLAVGANTLGSPTYQLYGDAGNQFWTGAPSIDGPFAVGSGLPENGGQPITVEGNGSGQNFNTNKDLFANFVASAQIAVSPDGQTIFVADTRTDGLGGILEYYQSLYNSWVLVGRLQIDDFQVTGATETGTTVTVTTSSTTDFFPGESVSVDGLTNPAYNGTYVVTSLSGNTFTYTSTFTGLSASGTSSYLANATGYDGGFNGLAVDWTDGGANDANVLVYATTTATSGNRLIEATGFLSSAGNNNGDTIGSGALNYTVLATAAPGTAFRGVAFAPTAPGTTPTTTALATSSTTGDFANGVTLTATVTSGATGWVSFINGTTGVEIGAAPVVYGTATLTTSGDLAPGTYSDIIATYTGDGTYAPSTSPSATFGGSPIVISQTPTTTTVSFNPNPIGTAQAVTITALIGVSSTLPVAPTGTVTFTNTNNSTTLGKASVTQIILNNSGIYTIEFVATLTEPANTFTQGAFSIQGVYAGDGYFAGSSDTETLNVVNSTTTVVTSSAADPTAGTGLTLTAAVTSTVTGTATGTVQFYDNTLPLGSPVTVTSGVATLPVSTSLVQSVTVTGASESTTSGTTTVVITTDANNPATVGETVVVEGITTAAYNGTFTVTAVSGDSFSYVDNIANGAAPNTNGGLAIGLNVLTPGLHAISAIYTPDSTSQTTFAGSTGILEQSVQSQGFGGNDIYEEREGDGVTSLNTRYPNPVNGSIGATLYIDEFTTSGTLVQSLALPTADSQSFSISAASEIGSTVTITTVSPNNYAVGQLVTIAGVTPSGYNGTFAITGINGNTFTYAAASGLTSPATSVTSATATGVVHAVVGNGQGSSSGQLTLSGDGQDLFLTGYDNNPLPYGTALALPTATGSASVPRSIAQISYNGTVATEAFSTSMSLNSSTSAVFDGVYSPDGNQFYVSGYNGVYYFPSVTQSATLQGSNAANQISNSSFTVVSLESYGGNLYAAGGGTTSGAGADVWQVGSGLPKPNVAIITAVSWTASVATITAANNFTTGQSVTIAGITTATGYNGTFTITSATTSQFTYALTTQPTGTPGLTGATASLQAVLSQLPGIPVNTTSQAIPMFFPVDLYLTHTNGAGSALDTLYVSDDGKSFGAGAVTKWSLNSVNITSITQTGTTATVNLSGSTLGLVVGEAVNLTISGETGTAAAYNGTWAATVNSSSATTFTFTAPTGLTGDASPAGQVSAFVEKGAISFSEAAPQLGFYWMTGTTNPATGAVTIDVTYGNGGNGNFGPGILYSVTDSNGYNNAPGSPITAVNWASGTVTVNAVNNYQVGSLVNVAGVTPAPYSGLFTITAANASSFSYALASNPGTATLSSAVALSLNTVNSVAYEGVGAFSGSETDHGVANAPKVMTTTLVDNGPNSSVYGQAVSFVVTVASPGSINTPTGTVSLKDTSNGNAIVATGTLVNGVYTFSPTTLGAGTHNLVVVYAGDVYHQTQNSNSVTQTVTMASTTTSLTDVGPNPSTSGNPVVFTGTVTGGVPNGDTVSLEDASNSNAVVATTTTTGGTGAFSFSVTSLSVGTHSLFAVYAGDANFTTSSSGTVSQVVNVAPPTVLSVVVNGDPGNATGPHALAGSHSRVATLYVTFSEAVSLGSGAFSLALHGNVGINGVSGQTGTLPGSLSWASSDNIHWTITFVGTNGVNVNVGADGDVTILDGVYDLTVNASQVHPLGVPGVNMAANATQTFWALFGDTGASDTITTGTIGDGHTTIGVGNGDFNAFANAYQATGYNVANGYLPTLDVDGDGSIGNVDFNAFANNYQTIWTF